jgi:multiple sugar transport system permease protein
MSSGRVKKLNSAFRREFLFHLLPYFFIALFLIYPFGSLIYYSFLKASVERPPSEWKFSGFRNYDYLVVDENLWLIVWNTIIYAFVGSGVPLIAGILIALLVNSLKGWLRRIISTILIIPMLIIPVVGGIIWSFLLSEHYGWFNILISTFGLETKAWLMTRYSLWFVILTDIWGWTPWVFIILFAGLQQLDPQVLEAANIDGATGFGRVRYIIIPMMRNLIIVVFLLKLVDTYKAFDYLWVMTEGGPGMASTTLNIAAYKHLVIFRDLGTASAFGVISMIFPMLMSSILVLAQSGRR